jgi:hypothetical protein
VSLCGTVTERALWFIFLGLLIILIIRILGYPSRSEGAEKGRPGLIAKLDLEVFF